jgi:hypothetical protein
MDGMRFDPTGGETLIGGVRSAANRSLRACRKEAIFTHPMMVNTREKTHIVLLKSPAIHIRLMTATALTRAAAPITRRACDLFLIFYEPFKEISQKMIFGTFFIQQKTCP